MPTILSKLEGGDRRSIGRSDEVVYEVLEKPELFDELVSGIALDDPLVRMRYEKLRPPVKRHIEELSVTGTPAMLARGRHLLSSLSG